MSVDSRPEQDPTALPDRLGAALDAARAGAWEQDLVSGAAWSDAAYDRLYGHRESQPDAPWDAWAARIHPDDRAATVSALSAALAGDDAEWTAGYRFRCADGTWVHVLDRASIARDEGGRAVRVIGAMIDVSEIRRAEETLRDNDRRLRTLAEALPQIVWTSDPRGNIEYLNGRWYGYTGEALGAGEGWGWQAVVHREDLDRTLARWTRALRTGEPYEAELRLRRADGVFRWFLARAFPLHDGVGAITRWFGTCTDVHEIKTVQQSVRDSEQRLALAIEASGAGAMTWDLVTGRVEWDARQREIFGVGAREPVSAELWRSRLHPDDAARVDAFVEAALREGHRFDIETRIVLSDGSVRWVRVALRLERDLAGTPLRFNGLSFDVTDQKRAEAELREADRHKNEFLAVLAHELRDPLAPVRNCVEILDRSALDPAQVHRAARIIERQLDHLTRLVDDLLDVSRIARGELLLEKKRVQLGDVVARAIETLRPVFEAKRQQLTLALPDEPAWVLGDVVRLTQVVANLLQNAAKFTPNEGRVRVAVEPSDGSVRVRVIDSGIGIARDDLARIFDLFVQGPEAESRAPSGLGVGLSLSKRLVEAQHGSLRAFSAGVGRGSEFTILLPTVPPPDERRKKSPGATTRRTHRVLIVDDNRDSAETLALVLQGYGHATLEAFDGTTALALATDARPEIALVDIGLPDLEGYEVATRLRALLPAIRLVAVTGYGQESDRARARAAGFDHHLVKPIDLDALLRYIGNA